MLYLIALVQGTVLVLDVPSRQQLTYRMVGRDDLPNAIALNSTLFNASRIFGPAVAGALLVAGVGVCFLVNANKNPALLEKILDGDQQYPSARVAPVSGDLTWILGEA